MKVIPEIKEYKELRKQLEREQKKLSEAQDAQVKLHIQIKELENKIPKEEATKNTALKRYAVSSETICINELDKIKKNFQGITREHNDTKELVGVVEAVIEGQNETLKQLSLKMKPLSEIIWNRIADIYQEQLEKALGDTVNCLWVAMRNSGRYVPQLTPVELPERLRKIAAPDKQESDSIQKKLWNEFVESDAN